MKKSPGGGKLSLPQKLKKRVKSKTNLAGKLPFITRSFLNFKGVKILAGRIRIGVLFGGRSGEHAVSLLSAASVMAAMDKNKYEIIPVGITEDGRWLAGGDPLQALQQKEVPGDCFFAALVTNPLSPGLVCSRRTVQEQGREVEFIPGCCFPSSSWPLR